jgi:altronate hydrolase
VISTLEEKSLGCIQKGGAGNITGVLKCGDIASAAGLNLLDGPGNDLVAVTELAAAGAHMILFTTGRGTPAGGPVPTIKISSNSELADKKRSWIDFDAGRLLHGVLMDDMAEHLMDYIIDVASGRTYTKNEINDYREISIFKNGVTV